MIANSIQIIGRLTKDPERKTTKGGKEYVGFGVAVNQTDKTKPADFFNCIAFDKQADFIDRYFSKGKMIAIRGEIHSSKREIAGQNITNWSVTVREVGFWGYDDNKDLPAQPISQPKPEEDDDFPF